MNELSNCHSLVNVNSYVLVLSLEKTKRILMWQPMVTRANKEIPHFLHRQSG